MTTPDSTTSIIVTPSHAASKLADNIAAAQHAGDLAYAFAERARAPLAERAVAYHVAFADLMRTLGSPLPCPCDLCTGGEAVQ